MTLYEELVTMNATILAEHKYEWNGEGEAPFPPTCICGFQYAEDWVTTFEADQRRHIAQVQVDTLFATYGTATLETANDPDVEVEGYSRLVFPWQVIADES